MRPQIFLGGCLCLYFQANIFKPEVKLLRLLSMLDLLLHQKICTTTNEMGCETFHSLSRFILSLGYLKKAPLAAQTTSFHHAEQLIRRQFDLCSTPIRSPPWWAENIQWIYKSVQAIKTFCWSAGKTHSAFKRQLNLVLINTLTKLKQKIQIPNWASGDLTPRTELPLLKYRRVE